VVSVKRLLVGVSSTPCGDGTAIRSSSSRLVADHGLVDPSSSFVTVDPPLGGARGQAESVDLGIVRPDAQASTRPGPWKQQSHSGVLRPTEPRRARRGVGWRAGFCRNHEMVGASASQA
jgi:hypothetical protein